MIAALIVAAGQGKRMGSAQPKQYLLLAGHPILVRTIQAFDSCAEIEHIYVVVPETDLEFCRQKIVGSASRAKKVSLVKGGDCRQDSVYNGLAVIESKGGIVLIHDGVRPLVSQALIRACIAGARRWEACIPATDVKETLKQVNAQGIVDKTVLRENLQMAQTPQAFQLALIKAAHDQARRQGWLSTDDASLVERMGQTVHVIPGSQENIKITTPEDLAWAETFYRRRQYALKRD